MGAISDLVDDMLARAAGRRGNQQDVPANATLARTDSGRQGKANVQLFRHWAEHSELVRGAIDIRRGQVAVAEWDIVPTDPDKTYSIPLRDQIKRLFDTPNPTISSLLPPPARVAPSKANRRPG